MSSRVVRARLDPASEQALALLVAEGRNESEAVRDALIEAAVRRRRRTALADEVARLAGDAHDTAERHAALADLDDGSWPS